MSLLTEDGTLKLIAGDHEPLNKELAQARGQAGMHRSITSSS